MKKCDAPHKPCIALLYIIFVGQQVKITGNDNVEPDGAYVIVANYPSGHVGFALIGTFPNARIVALAV